MNNTFKTDHGKETASKSNQPRQEQNSKCQQGLYTNGLRFSIIAMDFFLFLFIFPFLFFNLHFVKCTELAANTLSEETTNHRAPTRLVLSLPPCARIKKISENERPTDLMLLCLFLILILTLFNPYFPTYALDCCLTPR